MFIIIGMKWNEITGFIKFDCDLLCLININ